MFYFNGSRNMKIDRDEPTKESKLPMNVSVCKCLRLWKDSEVLRNFAERTAENEKKSQKTKSVQEDCKMPVLNRQLEA